MKFRTRIEPAFGFREPVVLTTALIAEFGYSANMTFHKNNMYIKWEFTKVVLSYLIISDESS